MDSQDLSRLKAETGRLRREVDELRHVINVGATDGVVLINGVLRISPNVAVPDISIILDVGSNKAYYKGVELGTI